MLTGFASAVAVGADTPDQPDAQRKRGDQHQNGAENTCAGEGHEYQR